MSSEAVTKAAEAAGAWKPEKMTGKLLLDGEAKKAAALLDSAASPAPTSAPAQWYFQLNQFKWFKYLHFYSLIVLSVINFSIDVLFYLDLLNVKRTLVLGPPSQSRVDTILLTLLLQFSIAVIEIGQLWDELFNKGAYSGDLTNSKLTGMFSIWLQYLPALWLNLQMINCYQRVFFISYLKAFFISFISIMRALVFIFNNVLGEYATTAAAGQQRKRFIYDYFKNAIRVMTFLGITVIVICTLTIQIGFIRVKTSPPVGSAAASLGNASRLPDANFDLVDVYMNFEVYLEGTEADLAALEESLKAAESLRGDYGKVKKYYAKSKSGKNQLPNLGMLLSMPRVQYTYDKMMRLTNLGELIRNGGREFVVVEKHVFFNDPDSGESSSKKKASSAASNKETMFICVTKWYPTSNAPTERTGSGSESRSLLLKKKKIKSKTGKKECYKIDIVRILGRQGAYTSNYYVKRLFDTGVLEEDRIRLVSKHLVYLEYVGEDEDSPLVPQLGQWSSEVNLLNLLNDHDAVVNPRLAQIGNLQFAAFRLDDPSESDDLATYIKKCMYRTPPYFKFSSIGLLQLFVDPSRLSEEKSGAMTPTTAANSAATADDDLYQDRLARIQNDRYFRYDRYSKALEFFVKEQDVVDLGRLKLSDPTAAAAATESGPKSSGEDRLNNKCHLQVNSYVIWNENLVFLNDKICETVLISTL